MSACNRPFPSSKKFHFQNEAKCETFVVEMSFNYDANKPHFHNKGFALSLVLKVKLFGTRKWPILFTVNTAIHLNTAMISSEFFLVICSSLWIGVKLTIFFKRRFQWREHFFARLDSANLILIIAAHFLLPEVWLLQIVTAVIAMVSAIKTVKNMYDMTNLSELVKSLVLGACIIVSWKSERGSYILPLSSVFFALTQFLRWPRRLKDFLSKVRIVCGPAFPLSVFATWLKRSEPSGSLSWVLPFAVSWLSSYPLHDRDFKVIVTLKWARL